VEKTEGFRRMVWGRRGVIKKVIRNKCFLNMLTGGQDRGGKKRVEGRKVTGGREPFLFLLQRRSDSDAISVTGEEKETGTTRV